MDEPADQTPTRFGRIPTCLVEAGGLIQLTGAEAKTVIVLSVHAGPDWTARPGVGRLAQLTGLDRRTVQRALRGLVAKGWLTIVEGGRGRRNTAVYRLKKGGTDAALSRGEKAASTPPLVGKGRRTDPEKAAWRSPKGGPHAARTEKNKKEQNGTSGQRPAHRQAAGADRPWRENGVQARDERARFAATWEALTPAERDRLVGSALAEANAATVTAIGGCRDPLRSRLLRARCAQLLRKRKATE